MRPRLRALLLQLGIFIFLFARVSALALAEEPTAPQVTGSTVYTSAQILEILTSGKGGSPRGSSEILAARLQARYHRDGYLAAQVQASVDASTGTTQLTVDEGRLQTIRVEGPGVDEQRGEQLVSTLPLKKGEPFHEESAWQALDALRKRSEGAWVAAGDPPFEWRREGAGVTLMLHVVRKQWRFSVWPATFAPVGLYNRVDGLTPAAKLSVTRLHAGSLPTNFYVTAGYALGPEKLRYAAGVVQPIGPRFHVGYEFHDRTDTDDAFRSLGFEDAPARMLLFSDVRDFFGRRGHEAYAFAHPRPHWQVGLTYRDETHESRPLTGDGSLFFNRTPRENPQVDEGHMRSTALTVRWSNGTLFERPAHERDASLLRSFYGTPMSPMDGARIEATYEWAPRDWSDFDFSRLIVHARARRALSPIVTIRGRALVGRGSGTLPSQKRFQLGGPGTLRGRPFGTLMNGRDMLLTTGEIALALRERWPGLVLFTDGGEVRGAGATPGWHQDAGVALEWPAGHSYFVRVETAWPVNRAEDGRTARTWLRVRVPF